MSEANKAGRRRRKRTAARTTAATAGPAAVDTAVRGGRYAPLDTGQLDQIHDAIVKIFDVVGLAEAPPVVIDTVTAAGGRISADRRLTVPPSLVERALKGLRKSVTLHGQRPGHEMTLEGRRVYAGSGGAAPYVVDLDTGVYRSSTLKDLY
ncbi:MAG: trimethylamine methyltransferase family protein, partial [Aestuariivirgaceae bacterium]